MMQHNESVSSHGGRLSKHHISIIERELAHQEKRHASLTLLGVGGQVKAAAAYSGPYGFYTSPTAEYYFNYSDSAKVLAAGGGVAGNGVNIATVNPETGSVATLQATQATVGNQPIVVTSALGAFQVMRMTSATSQKLSLTGTGNTAAPRNASAVSEGLIIKPSSVSGSQFLRFCYDASYSNHRWATYLFGTGLAVDCTPATAAHSTLYTGISKIASGTWVTILWEWNCAAGTGKIYVNGVSQTLTGTWPTAGNIDNTAIANNPPDMCTASGDYLEQFQVINALMGDTNALAWHTAAKAYYGF